MLKPIQGVGELYQKHAYEISLFSAYGNAKEHINHIANRMWDGMATDREWQDWLDIGMFIEKMDPIIDCYLTLTDQDVEKADDLAAKHAKAHSQKWNLLFDELEKAGFYQAHGEEEIKIFEGVIKNIFKYKPRKRHARNRS